MPKTNRDWWVEVKKRLDGFFDATAEFADLNETKFQEALADYQQSQIVASGNPLEYYRCLLEAHRALDAAVRHLARQLQMEYSGKTLEDFDQAHLEKWGELGQRRTEVNNDSIALARALGLTPKDVM